MTLSRFRVLERLPGAAHPAVFKVTFACDCGGEHEGLVTHEELDSAPLAGSDSAFLNLMTDRLELAAPSSSTSQRGRSRQAHGRGASSATPRSARGR